MNRIRKGDRIETSGKGRTGDWGTFRGVVSRRKGASVFVRWDGLHFEDEMQRSEVRREGATVCT